MMSVEPVREMVMIIDDHVDAALLMKQNFMQKGYEVKIFHTVYDAFQSIGLLSPTIVFIGPDLCGNKDEVVRQIREAAPDVQAIYCGKDLLYGRSAFF